MLSTTFVAVPAFNRVDPVTTSGPTLNTIATSASFFSSERASQVTPMIRARAFQACVTAPRTNGVIPLAEMPTTTSLWRGRSRLSARALVIIVLDTFLRAMHGMRAGRHDGDRGLGSDPKRGRQLGRFEHTEPAARARAHEDQTAALAHGLGHHLGTASDACLLALDGRQHVSVVEEHHLDHLAGIQRVEIAAARVHGFGRELLPF